MKDSGHAAGLAHLRAATSEMERYGRELHALLRLLAAGFRNGKASSPLR
jgi:hypothetical protein